MRVTDDTEERKMLNKSKGGQRGRGHRHYRDDRQMLNKSAGRQRKGKTKQKRSTTPMGQTRSDLFSLYRLF